MPRESIQITGIHFEKIFTNEEATGFRITVRTPDNSSFVVFEEMELDLAPATQFIGAQALLKLKREYQEKITAARVQ